MRKPLLIGVLLLELDLAFAIAGSACILRGNQLKAIHAMQVNRNADTEAECKRQGTITQLHKIALSGIISAVMAAPTLFFNRRIARLTPPLGRIPCILALCALASCVSSPHADSLRWTRKEIVGLTMTLDDPVREEWYLFHQDGSVSVTYGEKSGCLAAPLFDWKIQRGELVILDFDGKIFETFCLVARDSQTLKVRNRAGKTLVFKLLNAQPIT